MVTMIFAREREREVVWPLEVPVDGCLPAVRKQDVLLCCLDWFAGIKSLCAQVRQHATSDGSRFHQSVL